MKIDAHQHFWKYNHREYSWISDGMEVLKKDFLPSDLLPELKRLKFDGSIAIQARQTPEESRWLLEQAAKFDFIKGVVGWVDLCSSEVDDQLAEFAGQPKFIGVRHVLQDEQYDRYMLQEDFMRGISLLKNYNLAYDLLILPRHLPYAISFVKEFPDQRFVLDHIAKPLIKEKILSPWKEGIQELAIHPNVYCKLSGMVTEGSWEGLRREDFEPYLDVIFSSFGPSRLMIGSDWPVCTLASGYRETMQIVVDYIEAMDQREREMIMGGNAERIYMLDK
jgi:L-fuconolactonase